MGTGEEGNEPAPSERNPHGGLDNGFIRDLTALIQRVAALEPPSTVPSASECRFCDITAADCPVRIETADTATESRGDTSP